jgi:hypothetical protein
MAVSIAAITADRIAIRRYVRITPAMGAAHSIASGMQMIPVQRAAMLEISAAHGGGCARICQASHGHARTGVEAGSDRDSKIETGQYAYAHRERRHVNFAKGQRDPAHHGVSDNHARIEIGEGDQRGSVHGTNHGDRHGRHPGPRSADGYPTAVVERSPAPGSVIDPVPAPWFDPGPMTIAIGRPVRNQPGRKPYRTIGGGGSPHAKVPTQIGEAGKVARNEVRGDRGFLTRVAQRAKRVELVGRRHGLRIQVGSFPAGSRHLSTHMHRGHLVADIDFGVAGAHRGERCVSVFIDIHTVIAVAEQREGELGSVDLEAFPGRQRMQPDVQGPGGNLDLGHRVVQVQERKIGAPAHPHGRVIGLEFGQAILLSPDVIAIGHRVIQFRGGPIVDASGLKRNGSGEVAQTRDPAGRGCVVVLREGRERQQCAEG